MEFLCNLFKHSFENWIANASDEKSEDGYEERRQQWIKDDFGGDGEKTPEMKKINEEINRPAVMKWEKRVSNKTIRQGFLAFILGAIFLVACGNKDDEDAVKDYCVQYVSKYKVMQEKPEGKFEISVLAPDFEQVIETILAEDKEIEITSNVLEEAVEKYPNYEKEYIFYSDSDQIEDIEKAFLEEVSHELVVSAIKKVEYKEKWNVEE